MTDVFNQELLVGDIESTFRTAGVPDLLTDTFDVGPVTRTPNIQTLERNNQRASFSPTPSRTGRRQQAFQFVQDVAGSGVVDGSRAPAVGRFLRVCSFAETQFSAAGLAHSAQAGGNTRKGVTLTEGGTSAYAGTLPRVVVVEATAASTVSVTSLGTATSTAGYSQTGVSASTGVEFAGPQGAKMVLTYTGGLVAGDKYLFWFVPPGHLYSPASDPLNAESMYLYHYTGVKRHLLAGGRGTWSMSATAGDYAQWNFTITGDWNSPEAQALPALGSYDYGPYPTPPMVEQAYLQHDGTLVACPTTWGLDMTNAVTARLCANAVGANNGAIVTGRTPTLNFNMDSVALTDHDPWDILVSGAQVMLAGNVGVEPGNSVSFMANAQYSNVQDANLDNLRKNDISTMLKGIEGNDELLIFIT